MPGAPCGILLLDKPLGLSSNAALQRVRQVLGRPKAGHTGVLDPLASGMLPLCIGEATKVAGELLDGNKSYLFTARFGERTATGDQEGQVVETLPVPEDLEAVLTGVRAAFLGSQRQVPPMYSALKRDGQPLYRLARQGIEVERAPRDVVIHALELLAVEGVEARWRVVCSKGTYVRVLAEDIARAVGSCAHLVSLRREWSEPFAHLPMMTLEQVLESGGAVDLLPPEAALPQLPAVNLGAAAAEAVYRGQAVPGGGRLQGRVRLHGPDGRMLGVAEVTPEGWLQPRRLLLPA
ncbi:MAG: hypothetical protein RL026_2682 [Pseudomonadota bacterium]|jgi:tRNA pseudouridine55 synthase